MTDKDILQQGDKVKALSSDFLFYKTRKGNTYEVISVWVRSDGKVVYPFSVDFKKNKREWNREKQHIVKKNKQKSIF